MPGDEQDKQLVSAFSKPFGGTEGPQVFELNFGSVRHAKEWQEIAQQQASQLNMPIKFCNKSDTISDCAERYIFEEEEQQRGERAILIALQSGDDYTLLCNALGSELQEYITKDNAHTQAYLDHFFTDEDYQDLVGTREEFASAKAFYWKKRDTSEPSVKTETNDRTFNPSEQSLLDELRADMNS